MADQSIGAMEGAFFVSKGEILGWANKLLNLNLTKVEQFGTGSAYCQIVDSMFPGNVKMQRVNWKARNEWEFIINLKILQQSFQKCNIKKHIDIEKLARAKYQDNLEFAQWMKRFFDLNGGAQADYDPIKRRGGTVKESDGTVNDIEIDYGFVNLRDNSKIHRDNRNAAMQMDKENKKMISRSKSPIFKNLEKNPPLLYNKSREISQKNQKDVENLIQKFKQIEKITDKNDLKDDQKIIEIKQIIQAVNNLQLLQQQNKQNSYQQQQLSNNNSNMINKSVMVEKDRIIMEEEGEKSPKQQQQQKNINVKKRSSHTNGNSNTSASNLKKMPLNVNNVNTKENQNQNNSVTRENNQQQSQRKSETMVNSKKDLQKIKK